MQLLRALDVFFAGLAVVMLSPLLVLVIVSLRFTGEGEVFYRQDRVGRSGHIFGLLKFATMLKDSPNMGTGTITVRNDPRVLPVGRILRKTKINELPQLINVLVGDMSVIGPRPLTKNHFIHYPLELQKIICSVRPGLSGIGSIVFRDEERLLSDKDEPAEYYRAEIAPYKGELEAWFVGNQGAQMYFKCIFVTLWVVINSSSKVASRVFKGIPSPRGQLKVDLDATGG